MIAVSLAISEKINLAKCIGYVLSPLSEEVYMGIS